MVYYVVGLMFSKNMDKLVLIHKHHGPQCVIDKWNGVGGHVEPGEDALQAMIREFQEETGVLYKNWKQFCVLIHHNSECLISFFYACDDDAVNKVKTMTDEPIKTWPFFDIDPHASPLPRGTMQNIQWMTAFLRDQTIMDHNLGEINTYL